MHTRSKFTRIHSLSNVITKKVFIQSVIEWSGFESQPRSPPCGLVVLGFTRPSHLQGKNPGHGVDFALTMALLIKPTKLIYCWGATQPWTSIPFRGKLKYSHGDLLLQLETGISSSGFYPFSFSSLRLLKQPRCISPDDRQLKLASHRWCWLLRWRRTLFHCR